MRIPIESTNRGKLGVLQFALSTLAPLPLLGGGQAGCSSSSSDPTSVGGSAGEATAGGSGSSLAGAGNLAGTTATAGASDLAGASGSNATPTAGNAGGGVSSQGGAAVDGGAGGTPPTGASGSTSVAGAGSGLPWLTVKGNKLQDPTGKTIVLRGSSLIDIGSLYWYGGQSVAGITARMEKIAAAGVQGHVVRLPVYPKIDYNTGGDPACSPCPYPVGTGPTASCTPKSPLSAEEYVAKVLTPAVDYATSKNLYVIIDYHQIDNVTTGTAAADAKTFWKDIAPRFAGQSNVLYEPFNEPIDNSVPWSGMKPVVQELVDTIRASAPKNLIIVPSNTWDQRPGDAASDPPTGTNFMYTAHIYGTNWQGAFQTQVATATAKAPVFITEWGFDNSDPSTFGTSLQMTTDGNGASWTAWVTDNGWTPSMFADSSLTALTNFGTLVKSWLATTGSGDWVQ